MERLQRQLGVQFADPTLLRTALTHRSHSTPHNERLEFLGDGILNCVVADLLYGRFPDLTEGELSRLRANLVRQDALHGLALKLRLGECLLLGEGELKSGGHSRPSILADTLEAILGATYLDMGFDAARQLVARLYQELLDGIVPGRPMKDPKTRLQEHLQGKRLALPQYLMLGAEGEAHAQRFEVACRIEALKLETRGSGTSRRAAEQMAAEKALEQLGI